MNIAIVGAGAAGTASAHALQRDGHAITVYDQHSSAAEGASALPNIWLNLGHGNNGAALADGAGQLLAGQFLADLIAECTPAIDMNGLTPQR